LKPFGTRSARRRASSTGRPDGSAGTLERILPFGTVTRAIVTIDRTRILVDAAARAPRSLTALEPGGRVGVQIDGSAARVLP
jgi:hypothetical protein